MTNLQHLIEQCFSVPPHQLPPVNRVQGKYYLDAYYMGGTITVSSESLSEVLDQWIHFVLDQQKPSERGLIIEN